MTIKPPSKQERTAMTDYMIEAMARRIYESAFFGTWFQGSKPSWVDGGNSEAQSLARDFARAAHAAAQPYIEAEKAKAVAAERERKGD